MCISLLVTSRRKAAAVVAFPTKGRMKAHYFCPQLGVIHPTASTPWAFSGRFKITAPFSWLHNAQESLLLEVLPCYPTNCCWGPNQLAVSVCAEQTLQVPRGWIGGGEQEGERREILQHLCHLYGVTAERDKQGCLHFPPNRLQSSVLLKAFE